ncbi:hypothetical protein PsorP6_001654 [Peronosclerospora sorghi]|uniref:Uncharacterized protein n=1 Tax=Peronosclerospora sorghi TaxID=230839 RepID=A0ACC0WYL4_9STRA|nr:hypothetical protein PsorP6_001654 [Peronosclerospora sorghi]
MIDPLFCFSKFSACGPICFSAHSPKPSHQPNHPSFALPKACFSANTQETHSSLYALEKTHVSFQAPDNVLPGLEKRRGGTLATRTPWSPHGLLMAKRSKEKSRSSEIKAWKFFRLVQIVKSDYFKELNLTQSEKWKELSLRHWISRNGNIIRGDERKKPLPTKWQNMSTRRSRTYKKLPNLSIRTLLTLLLAASLLALVRDVSFLHFQPTLRHVWPVATPVHEDSPFRAQKATESSTRSRLPSANGVSVDDLLRLKASSVRGEAFVPPADRYHLSLLHEACMTHKDAIVRYAFGAPGPNQTAEELNLGTLVHEADANVLDRLKQCPDVDIFLPSHVRNSGYCEDTMAYTKYLHARLLPRWAVTKRMHDPSVGRHVDYFDLCPHTPMLFVQHYWDNLPSSPRWPAQKRLYLMPNIEMWELNETHYARADVVLCKTRVCATRVKQWYDQEGNPRETRVLYTKHTSSDQASYARRVLGERVQAKNFTDVRFRHTARSSFWKGTRQVIECWLSRPDFPPLDLYMHEWAYRAMFQGTYDERIASSQIRLITDELDALAFDTIVAESAYFLCPSQMEGYGHYLNQARASGGVIITTDLDPMNELIATDDMGLKVRARRRHDRSIFLDGKSKNPWGLRNVPGMVAAFSFIDLCQTVEHLLNVVPIEKRTAMGEKARVQYHKDTKFFEQAMIELRILARYHASGVSSKDETMRIRDRPTTG